MSDLIPHLGQPEWLLAIIGAISIGLAKAGFAGIGMVAVIIFANMLGARDSTGMVLPLLVAADIGAVSIYRGHARWDYVWRTLPPAAVGVVVGAYVLSHLDNASFKPILGAIILALTIAQLVRLRRPQLFTHSLTHSRTIALSLGLLAGITTMMANAAGPLAALYLVAVGLPKFEVVGTLAWFFFLINLFKMPFSVGIGVVDRESLVFDAILGPAVVVGLFAGRWLIHRIPQKAFDIMMLAFAALASIRLMF